ncbi:hypothetical protein VKT23_000899 [Stygiomarasmius scandens]|uniref:Early meiotic induction protein 1 n=1 Tax=Marasmiellus scandens TaxID=2682957 RepID=A0ABR1K7C2_9AGAR
MSDHPDFEKTVQQEQAYLRLVHPTPEETPTCFNLFDTYLSCNAARSQIKSYYRHGEGTQCGTKLEDWKFCLGLKSLEPDQYREAWIRRRAEWWAQRRLGKSSEDVWEMRTEPVPGFPKPLSDRENLELKVV